MPRNCVKHIGVTTVHRQHAATQSCNDLLLRVMSCLKVYYFDIKPPQNSQGLQAVQAVAWGRSPVGSSPTARSTPCLSLPYPPPSASPQQMWQALARCPTPRPPSLPMGCTPPLAIRAPNICDRRGAWQTPGRFQDSLQALDRSVLRIYGEGQARQMSGRRFNEVAK